MKKLLSILILSILGFSACSSVNPNTPMQNITKENLNSFKELIGLEDDMGVFYVMHGIVDGKEQGAYLEITKPSYEMSDDDTSDRVTIKFIESDDDTIFAPLDSKDLSFGIDSGNLIVSGTIKPEAYFVTNGSTNASKTIDFNLTQDSNAKINKIYYVESKKEEVLKNKNGEEITYSNYIRKPIIPDSTLPNVDKLNKSISNATSVGELRQNLESYLKNEYDDRIKGFDIDNGGFGLAYEELSSIGYIDDNILEVDTLYEYYSFSANHTSGIQLYDINTGETLPSTVEEIFDINDKNKEAFLALLSSYIKQEHLLDLEDEYDNYLFHDVVSNNIPNTFSLGSPLGRYGVSLEWGGSHSDFFSLTIRYDSLGMIMDYMRDGVLKDYINAIVSRHTKG